MAIIGLLMGSVLGFFAAIVGWLILDLTALSAVSLYLCTGLVIGGMTVIVGMIRPTETLQGAPARAF